MLAPFHPNDTLRRSELTCPKSCKRCTAWVETQEPEVVPAPLETGHISIEEERGEAWPARFIDSTDFFSDDAYPQVRYHLAY